MAIGLMSIPRPAAETLGYDKKAALSQVDQFNAQVVAWNAAYVLSKPKPLRDLMMLRQQGQGGSFATEAEAVEARLRAAENVPGADYIIDVIEAGLAAFQTLVLRANNPLPGATPAVPPDLFHPPTQAADLNTGGDQPFVEWGSHTSNGDPCWDALPTDHTDVGGTWTGFAKHTAAPATYVKVRDYPWGQVRDRWFVKL